MEYVRCCFFIEKEFLFEIYLYSSGILTYLLLGGQTPFIGGSDYQTLQNIRQGNWTFGDRFPKISADGKDFITRLLNPDQQNRLTSEQALNHPWLRFALQHVDTAPITSDRLQGVYSRQLYDVRGICLVKCSKDFLTFSCFCFSVIIDVHQLDHYQLLVNLLR